MFVDEELTDKVMILDKKLKVAEYALLKANDAFHDADCDFVQYKMQKPCNCFKRDVKKALEYI